MHQKKTSATSGDNLRLNQQKQTMLKLIQAESQFADLIANLKIINDELADAKDLMRKYREKSIPSLAPTSDVSWQNQPIGVYVLSQGSFFHEIPVNKLAPYLETRIDRLSKSKKHTEDGISKIVQTVMQWMRNKVISSNDIGSELLNKVRQRIEQLEDIGDDQ